jgi:hypothetical protein
MSILEQEYFDFKERGARGEEWVLSQILDVSSVLYSFEFFR